MSDLNAQALEVARQSRGTSQGALAEAVGVSQGMISKAEAGVVMLKPETVQSIADLLDYPFEFFFEGGWLRTAGSGCLYHQKRKTTPAKVLSKVNARMEIRRLNVRRLFAPLDLISERPFVRLDPDEFGQDPTEIAREIRQLWRIPPGPIKNMTQLIESAGGIIFLGDFGSHKLRGVSCWENEPHPLFYLNAHSSSADLRWTLAHELGHLVMHRFPTEGDREVEADMFAGEFLAPQAEIGAALRRLRFDSLPALKVKWGISIKAIITQAEKRGAISRSKAKSLYQLYSARRWHNAEPHDVPIESPTLVRTAVRAHLDDLGYSIEELKSAIRIQSEEDFVEFWDAGPPRKTLRLV